MNFLNNFISAFFFYSKEMFVSVAVGFFISGLINQFMPGQMIEKCLGKKGLKPIFLSTLLGTLLPVCCFGTLPIAMTLRQKGARLGPVLAFLVATPATSISALFVCWKLLGPTFTVYIFFSVIILGMVMGILADRLPSPSRLPREGGNLISATESGSIEGHSPVDKPNCCAPASQEHSKEQRLGILERIKRASVYAFITLPKEIGLQLLIGIAVASFLVTCLPVQEMIRNHLSGGLGFLFILVVGLLDYVCSTASVPVADALIKSGLTPGHAMTYLILGPVTAYGSMLVIYHQFGRKVLAVYLVTISTLSLAFGVIYNFLVYKS